MWLIDTTSLELKYVDGPGVHPYAILSHTWGKQEITFQDFRSHDRNLKDERFSKILRFCELARNRGFQYAWVDTCCIDKTSSAELTEAINSMFRWYKESAICFVYLVDLVYGLERDLFSMFKQCRWFERGWTLQELIAPRDIEFYDGSWNPCGDKPGLQAQLSDITTIDEQVLEDSSLLSTVPVARRMSWASQRRTTREEDLAYCLFGIFDVHLPLIYGEGPKAFIRLQEAIAHDINDLSLFAWTIEGEEISRQKYQGIFAPSPAEFRSCNKIRLELDLMAPSEEYAVTNRGVRFTPILDGTWSSEHGEMAHLLPLKCYEHSRATASIRPVTQLYIPLVQTSHGYARRSSSSLLHGPFEYAVQQHTPIYIARTMTPRESELLETRLSSSIGVEVRDNTSYSIRTGQEVPAHLWDPLNHRFITDGDKDFIGFFGLQAGSYGRSILQDRRIAVSLYVSNSTGMKEVVPRATVVQSADAMRIHRSRAQLGDPIQPFPVNPPRGWITSETDCLRIRVVARDTAVWPRQGSPGKEVDIYVSVKDGGHESIPRYKVTVTAEYANNGFRAKWRKLIR